MEFIDIDIGEDEREEFLEKYTKLILEPYDHIAFYPGKKVREVLVSICNYWFGFTNEELDIITSFITHLQNVCLLLDDIQDNSFKRRGAPAAHIIYGRARTIASVDYVLNKTLYENIPRHLQIPIRHCVAIIGRRCLKGQIMDTYWRDNFICPTEEAYIDMVYKKTGALFQFVFYIATAFSVKKVKDLLNTLEALGKIMGLHFQLRDDYCNLKSDKYFKEKGFCEDITEGKFSYPIICALRNHPNDRRIVEILKMNTIDDAIKRECVELIEKYGGFEDTRNKLSILSEQISNEIDNLGGGPIKDLWMQIVDFQI